MSKTDPVTMAFLQGIIAGIGLTMLVILMFGCKEAQVELEQSNVGPSTIAWEAVFNEVLPQAEVLTCELGSSRKCSLTMDEFSKASQLDRIELLNLISFAAMGEGDVSFELSVCCQIIDRIHAGKEDRE